MFCFGYISLINDLIIILVYDVTSFVVDILLDCWYVRKKKSLWSNKDSKQERTNKCSSNKYVRKASLNSSYLLVFERGGVFFFGYKNLLIWLQNLRYTGKQPS